MLQAHSAHLTPLWGNKTDKRQEVREHPSTPQGRRDQVPLIRPSNKVEAHRYRGSVWGHTSHVWQNLKSSPGVWSPLAICFSNFPCHLSMEKCPLLVTGRCDESRRQRCEARKMERRIQMTGILSGRYASLYKTLQTFY